MSCARQCQGVIRSVIAATARQALAALSRTRVSATGGISQAPCSVPMAGIAGRQAQAAQDGRGR